ncbi:MAG TPA: 5'-3' exonuclease [Actinomycetota bacterium]|nr:5'-3' exonuclease [Actinomycetota bacterium]
MTASHGLTLLVDAPSLVYRAYFSTPDTVRASDGRGVNAVHGFFGMLARLIADHDPARIACAADVNWRPEWRVALVESYKRHRTEAGSVQQTADAALAEQVPIAFELLARVGVVVAGHPEYEAEDVIGTLAARTEGPVAIVSGDRDLFQLVRDPDVYVLYPRRGVSVLDRVDEAYIAQRYGIPPRAYRDYAVLRGDASDGLPGVRGIGEKIAASLLTRYGSLDDVVAAAREDPVRSAALGKVRRELDYVERAARVVTIATDVPLPTVDLTRPRPAPDDALRARAAELGLAGALARLVNALRRP